MLQTYPKYRFPYENGLEVPRFAITSSTHHGMAQLLSPATWELALGDADHPVERHYLPMRPDLASPSSRQELNNVTALENLRVLP